MKLVFISSSMPSEDKRNFIEARHLPGLQVAILKRFPSTPLPAQRKSFDTEPSLELPGLPQFQPISKLHDDQKRSTKPFPLPIATSNASRPSTQKTTPSPTPCGFGLVPR